MSLFKLIRAFQKAKGRSPTPGELSQLKKQAAAMQPTNVLPFGRKKRGIEDLLKSGEVTWGTAPKTKRFKDPVDPRFQAAVDRQESFAAFKKRMDDKNKQNAYKSALRKAKEIDKKKLSMEEVETRYRNLAKYPEGRTYLYDEIYDIERGWTHGNLGQRSKADLVSKIKGYISESPPPRRPSKKTTQDPFKEPNQEVEGQLEMDFTDWDDKGMAGGGLAYMLGEGGRIGYIHGGITHPDGRRGFFTGAEADARAGTASMSPGTHHGGGERHGSDADDDQKALSYVNWNQRPTSEPKHGGSEGSWMDYIPGIGMARRAAKFLGPMGDERNLALRHDWLQKQGYLGEGEEDDGKWTSEYLKSPEGLAELKGMGYKTVDDFQPGGKYYHEGSDSYPRYAQQRSSLGLDSIQSTNKDDFDLYAVAEGREPSRFYSGGGSVGMPPMTYGLDFLARYQYPPSEGNTLGQFKDDVFKRLVPDIGINYRSPKGWSFGAGPTIGKGDKTMHFQFRKEFKKGGFNKGRRNFLKLMGGLAALPIVGKYFKLAKPAATAVKAVETSNAAGMPAWFPKLVDKVMKEGKDVSKQYATTERVIVKEAQLPGSKTKILVEQDLTTGNTAVDIGLGKHGWADGRHGQPVRLHLQKGEWIEPKKGQKKGVKTKDEFDVEEAEFTGDAESVKFEDVSIEKYGDHASDFSEVERYATGKNLDKKIIGKKRARDDWAEGHAEAMAEQVDEFASGGVAHLLGE